MVTIVAARMQAWQVLRTFHQKDFEEQLAFIRCANEVSSLKGEALRPCA